MARRKYSKEEVKQWQEEHHQNMLYINRNDSNLFVKRRYNYGWTVNLTHPGAWVLILVILGFVLYRIFHKALLG